MLEQIRTDVPAIGEFIDRNPIGWFDHLEVETFGLGEARGGLDQLFNRPALVAIFKDSSAKPPWESAINKLTACALRASVFQGASTSQRTKNR